MDDIFLCLDFEFAGYDPRARCRNRFNFGDGCVGDGQVPHMELPSWLSPILIPMIWLIEVFGMFVKHFVLAIRLFANMFAGHLVLAVFVGLIGVFGWVTSVAVGPGMLGVSVLELLVAFIQAYVFTFLSALFIGAAVHPH